MHDSAGLHWVFIMVYCNVNEAPVPFVDKLGADNVRMKSCAHDELVMREGPGLRSIRIANLVKSDAIIPTCWAREAFLKHDERCVVPRKLQMVCP